MMKTDYQTIESKEELLGLLHALHAEDEANWTYLSTKDFLGALAAWLEDAEGFYKNLGIQARTDAPSWQLFADAMQAATVYE